MQSKVAAILFFFQIIRNSVGQGCQYQYTIQPPLVLSCNPYLEHAIYLECAINGPNLQKIQWFFSNDSDTYELSNNGKYLITNLTTDADITSRLVVNGFVDDSDAGMYWCTGILEGGSTLQTLSSELVVEEQYIYEGLFNCIKDLFLKNSELQCTSVVPDVVKTTSQGTVTSTEATTANGKGLWMHTVTEEVGSPSPWSFNNILIAVLSLVAVLFIICIILMIVIGLQCRRRQRMKSFHDNSGEFLRSVTQSTESQFNRKDASGEYAEIGPAIIATVAQHMTDNPHYSSINGSMLKPPHPPSCVNPVVHCLEYPDGCHMVENPYDAPTSPKEADATQNEVDKYSRLDRVVPGAPSMEKRISMCTGIPEQTEVPSQNTNSPSKIPASTGDENDGKIEHPYYILEEPKDTTTETSDTESWCSGSCHSIRLPKDATLSFENHGIGTSPTGEERYQTSDNFNSHDASKNTYDHLESRDLVNSQESKYRNIEQYLEPITMAKSNTHADENANSNCNEGNGTTLKYSGDYERDPTYMERIQNSSSKTPSPHYQTLAESTLDPPDNYTKLQAFCK